ncbi:MAG: aminotransferase DegT [Alphaproteobacteria bacterium]|nr:MAG: aminotransferase DegT [Alphaproteobacteria bacterium]
MSTAAAPRVAGLPPLAFIDLQAQRSRLGDRIDRAIARVLEHGRFILGPEVAELEQRLAEFSGARHVVACSNGTDALVLALRAKGVGNGDAVLVPSFTFAATAEAVVLTGATPVFLDVAEDSFNLNPDGIEVGVAAARTAGLAPRGIIAVDLFGQPADHDAIGAAAAAFGLWVVDDAAQSFGAERGGRRVGTLAEITTTSFFPAKPLGCYGDGGAVLTDDAALAALLRSLRAHGQGSDKYDNVRIGINGRLDTLQAAILLEKLAIFPEEIAARERAAQRYGELLGDIVSVPRLAAGATSVWAQYTVKLSGRNRDSVAKALTAEGVPTAVYYPLPLHRQTAYRQFPVAGGALPVSDRLSKDVLSLPMHPYLDEPAQERVAATLRRALG